MSEYTIYRDEDGTLLIKHSNGTSLSVEDAELIERAIKNTQLQENQALLRHSANSTAKACTWLFPEKDTEVFGVQCGVYFATALNKSGLVKIGFSRGSIVSRVHSLKSNGVTNPRILAIAKVQHPHMFEKALHALFSDDHFSGEWFYDHNVRQFLGQFKGGAK